MRNAIAVVATLISIAEAGAQSITVTPLIGGTRPVAGQMVMYAPVPIPFGDSAAIHHRFGPGMSLGILAEFDRVGPLDFAAQFSMNLAERTRSVDDGESTCLDKCSSTIYGLALTAGRQFKASDRSRIHVAIGPEILHLTGPAVTNDGDNLPPYAVVVDPRTLVGGFASIGYSYATTDRDALRVQLGYRYFKPQHTGEYPSIAQPSHHTEAYQDLVLTVGVSRRLR